MKHKLTFWVVALIAMADTAFAYDFSYTYQGKTLYYNIVDGHVEVVRPGTGYDYNNYVSGDVEIPASVDYEGTTYSVTALGYIGYGTFELCSGLTSISIPASITSIGSYAFNGCSGLISVNYTGTVAQWCNIDFSGIYSNPIFYAHSLSINGSPVTNIVIPDNVTEIKDCAFVGCSELISVTISDSVTSIGSAAFAYCSSLTSIIVTDENTVYDSRNNCNAIIETASNTLIAGCMNTIIPATITSIGDDAFNGCTNLTSVTIPDGVTYIGDYAFNYCSGLSSVTIPNGITSIGNSVFSNCSGLTYITIPANITSIGQYAFNNCSGLTSIAIPDGITTIGDGAFYSCSGLTSVIIGNSVTSIVQYVFAGCNGLTSVTIGSSVSSIGYGAFSGCNSLSEIISEALVAPTLNNSSFGGVSSTIDVHIPCGSLLSYYSRWSYFSNFIEENGFTLNTQSADTLMGNVVVLTTPTCQSPQAVIFADAVDGYLFDYWSDGDTNNPRTLTLTCDTSLTAYFAPINSQSIDEVEALNAKVYSSKRQIVVEGAVGNTVTLYDLSGHYLASKQDYGTAIRFDVLVSGTYMIKIGNYPARKVVVVR